MKFYAPSGLQNVYRSLALENLLLESLLGPEVTLSCWRGESAVVMGKNQNPWRECNLAWIQEQKLRLARRVSGGGAVYHDEGNLNISWNLPRGKYQAADMHNLLIRALSLLNIPAEVSKGGSITVDGKKISGSAFCYRKDRVLHHGTLLMEANLPRLRSALSPRQVKMETHAVPSQPAPVVNLKTLNPQLTVGKVQRALIDAAEKVFGPATPLSLEAYIDQKALDMESERLASAEWIWGQTPGFHSCLKLSEENELTFKVQKGEITEMKHNDRILPLAKRPGFPEGDYSEIEHALGLSPGDFGALLIKEGWAFPGLAV